MPARSPLADLIATYPSLLVGYSGGVDSALLAVVARQVLGKHRTVAALGISASYPRVQHEQAHAIARQFDLSLVEVKTDELNDPGYVANAPSRCYFCKRELWSRMATVAAERGMAVIADGTNADDLGEHRPGLTAAREAEVVTPLADAGYTKADVRAEARALGIPIWNAPAAPCLSSRIQYGIEVTPLRLKQVEEGEDLLRRIGVTGDLRVRHRGDEARVEVGAEQFDRVRAHREELASLLDLGFARVTLDLNGYRRGSFLRAGEPRLEVLARG